MRDSQELRFKQHVEETKARQKRFEDAAREKLRADEYAAKLALERRRQQRDAAVNFLRNPEAPAPAPKHNGILRKRAGPVSRLEVPRQGKQALAARADPELAAFIARQRAKGSELAPEEAHAVAGKDDGTDGEGAAYCWRDMKAAAASDLDAILGISSEDAPATPPPPAVGAGEVGKGSSATPAEELVTEPEAPAPPLLPPAPPPPSGQTAHHHPPGGQTAHHHAWLELGEELLREEEGVPSPASAPHTSVLAGAAAQRYAGALMFSTDSLDGTQSALAAAHDGAPCGAADEPTTAALCAVATEGGASGRGASLMPYAAAAGPAGQSQQQPAQPPVQGQLPSSDGVRDSVARVQDLAARWGLGSAAEDAPVARVDPLLDHSEAGSSNQLPRRLQQPSREQGAQPRGNGSAAGGGIHGTDEDEELAREVAAIDQQVTAEVRGKRAARASSQARASNPKWSSWVDLDTARGTPVAAVQQPTPGSGAHVPTGNQAPAMPRAQVPALAFPVMPRSAGPRFTDHRPSPPACSPTGPTRACQQLAQAPAGRGGYSYALMAEKQAVQRVDQEGAGTRAPEAAAEAPLTRAGSYVRAAEIAAERKRRAEDAAAAAAQPKVQQTEHQAAWRADALLAPPAWPPAAGLYDAPYEPRIAAAAMLPYDRPPSAGWQAQGRYSMSAEAAAAQAAVRGGKGRPRRFVDGAGNPTTVSAEEAKLLASIARLDAAAMRPPPLLHGDPRARAPGYPAHEAAQPSLFSLEEARLMASLDRLDLQLKAVSTRTMERARVLGVQVQYHNWEGMQPFLLQPPDSAPAPVKGRPLQALPPPQSAPLGNPARCPLRPSPLRPLISGLGQTHAGIGVMPQQIPPAVMPAKARFPGIRSTQGYAAGAPPPRQTSARNAQSRFPQFGGRPEPADRPQSGYRGAAVAAHVGGAAGWAQRAGWQQDAPGAVPAQQDAGNIVLVHNQAIAAMLCAQ